MVSGHLLFLILISLAGNECLAIIGLRSRYLLARFLCLPTMYSMTDFFGESDKTYIEPFSRCHSKI